MTSCLSLLHNLEPLCPAAVILAQGSIIDVSTALIGIVSLLLLWRLKLPEPLLVGAAAIAGVLLYRG